MDTAAGTSCTCQYTVNTELEVNSISFRALTFKMLNKQYVGRITWRYKMGKNIQKETVDKTTYSIIVNVLSPTIEASEVSMQHTKVSKRTQLSSKVT
jgi:hypothetical protein